MVLAYFEMTYLHVYSFTFKPKLVMGILDEIHPCISPFFVGWLVGEIFCYEIPIDEFPEMIYISRAIIAGIDIVGMFPYITGE